MAKGSVFGGIDPGRTIEESVAMLHWPLGKRVDVVPVGELLDISAELGVASWTIEFPRTYGPTSGYKAVWEMHETATIIREILSGGEAPLYSANSNELRQMVADWRPLLPSERKKLGIAKQEKFDDYWYRTLPSLGYPVGSNTILLNKTKTHRRDGLLAAMFSSIRPALIEQWRYYPISLRRTVS